MKNYDQLTEINQNLHWPYIPDHPHRILIIGGSGFEKINALFNWIKNKRPDVDKIYLFVKVPFESKYQLLINGRENVGTENLKNAKAFIDYSQTIDDVYENLKDHNPTKKKRVLIVFDDVIADMESNKSINISFFFVSQSYFKVCKTIRLNKTHYSIMKIPNKRELQQIVSNHLFDIEFRDVIKLYKDYTKDTFSFLVNNTTLSPRKSIKILEEPIIKWLLARKSKESITKYCKTKLNKI